jgi:hypothetical protein
MIKADMAVLANHPERTVAASAIRDIRKRKKYFLPESTFDRLLFALSTHHLYWVYGLIYSIRFREKNGETEHSVLP